MRWITANITGALGVFLLVAGLAGAGNYPALGIVLGVLGLFLLAWTFYKNWRTALQLCGLILVLIAVDLASIASLGSRSSATFVRVDGLPATSEPRLSGWIIIPTLLVAGVGLMVVFAWRGRESKGESVKDSSP